MCGIAAAVGPVERVREVVRALRHRGPDQAGAGAWGPFGLGAARLRVTGDARADQPLELPGRVALVANGEVFNHRDLRGNGGFDAGEGDLPPLLRLLDRSFAEAPAAIRGPFALAALDRRRGLLMLARDEHGVRPLHVASVPSGIVAASEIWPLVAYAGVAPDLDYAALAHLIAFQFLPPGRTLFRSIASVRPGEILVYDPGARLASREAFRFRGGADASLAEALRAAVALQGPRDQRAAIFLSGGLDSSAVAGLLVEAGHPPNVALTGFFPDGGPAFDERPHARAVAAELGIPLVEVPIGAEEALEALPALVRALGGPLAGPGGLAQFLLARAAAREGARIVYSGEGGDELFGGYERHRLLQQIERGGATDPLPGYEALARLMADAEDPYAAAVFRGGELLSLLDVDARLDVGHAAFSVLPRGGPGHADRALRFERERFLPGLLAVDDATLAACGLEGRVPLLDPVVSRVACAIALGAASPPRAPRQAFRAALREALPAAAARRRDKMGFPMPLDAWLAAPPWREYALDRLRPSSLERFGFVGAKVRMAFEHALLSARARFFLLALDAFDAQLAARVPGG